MIGIKVEKAHGEYDPGTSKFFGSPTMPEEWLSDGTIGDEDFFFCQLKLSEFKNYDKENETLVLKDVYFSSRVKKYNKKTVIIAVDESGSMLGSVIYSAVMAQIMSKLPFAEIKLVIFDTEIVDLSGMVEDPVEVMMSVQLGGGTDIGKALSYCESLIQTPSDTCVLCVTDLCEGGYPHILLNTAQNIMTSGARLSFLTALDECANPVYDKNMGQHLADMGAFVGALTPDQLGDYIGRIFS